MCKGSAVFTVLLTICGFNFIRFSLSGTAKFYNLVVFQSWVWRPQEVLEKSPGGPPHNSGLIIYT